MHKILVILAALALAAPLAAEEWHKEAVDSLSGGGEGTALVLDGSGHPRMAYIANNKLWYACWNGSDWSYASLFESDILAGLLDLVLDDDEYPHIAYCTYEVDPVVSTYFFYTYFDEFGQHDSTIDSSYHFPSFPQISLDLDADLYPHVSMHASYYTYAYWDGDQWRREKITGRGDIALDGDDRPTIATCWTGDELTFAVRESEGWTEETVDADVSSKMASLAYDSLNRPHISYYDSDGDDLRYAYHNGSDWHVETVDAEGDVGNYNSLALDSDDQPHIAYYDATEDDLVYTHYSGGEWHREVVDAVGEVSLYTSLALDSFDRPHITYNHDTLGAVMYAALVEDLFHLVWPEKGEEIDTLNPTLDWEDHDIPDQASYTLRWALNPDFTDYEEVTGIQESEYQITAGLQEGDRVWWRVKSVDEGEGEHWAEEMDWYFDLDLGGGVDIVELGASPTDGGVLIYWRFEGGEPVGIEIRRSDGGGEPVALLDGPLPGSASRCLDREVTPDVEYIYWLDVTGADGTVTSFGPTEAVKITEPKIKLTLSAYPNPADDTVTLRFDLPDDCRVVLAVYDLAGRRVTTLMDGELVAGRHDVTWDCADLKPGVYLFRLETTGGDSTERLVVSR
ncbi:MAG: hypothetical protein A2Y64_07525 [Candidatus Coatesbacteria bacterium RBG_13_66_14]|uniref:Secretion system C-terminal sorting domain-containing protein n=1 Tax=Candidatus Coatesbacteria bacterium RBG_13_66_14 TaxID=1817816 RepID=A0A1F5EY65_9BACT|nr:MAG: hypothetical protein A2Y64_07525 [Candidatus Coatesbacteria bacterium RBG_13_66_14]